MRSAYRLVLATMLMLSAAATAATAATAPFLRLHGFFYEAPNLGAFADVSRFPVVGIGIEGGLRCGDWSVSLGAGAGWGGADFTDVTGTTEESRVRARYFRGGIDRRVALAGAELYAGPAAFWSRSVRGHGSAFEPFHELEPYDFYGFEARAGLSAPIVGRWLEACGEFAMMVGRGRIEDQHDGIGVVAAWSTSPAFRGGLTFRL